MASRGEHYRQAEHILADVTDFDEKGAWGPGARESLLQLAEIHAQLACVDNQVYNEYLDLLSLEQMRDA